MQKESAKEREREGNRPLRANCNKTSKAVTGNFDLFIRKCVPRSGAFDRRFAPSISVFLGEDAIVVIVPRAWRCYRRLRR